MLQMGRRQEASWYQNEYQKSQKAPLLQTPEGRPGQVPYLEDIPVLATSHPKVPYYTVREVLGSRTAAVRE